MIMKGGMLLAVRYQSDRFTKDIDFSTLDKFQNFEKEAFIIQLEESLLVAGDSLPYQVQCVVQSSKIMPRENATFPTLKLTIGYARKDDQATMRRLQKKQSPQIVKIDYSFNESTYHPEPLVLSDDESIEAYGFIDLMAEKIRAVIQQVVRSRTRRQDIYDLAYLIHHVEQIDDEEKFAILDTLHRKSVGRLTPEFLKSDTLRREDIKASSEAEYELLESEVVQPLPDFDEIYEVVVNFYESLPWAAYQSAVNGID